MSTMPSVSASSCQKGFDFSTFFSACSFQTREEKRKTKDLVKWQFFSEIFFFYFFFNFVCTLFHLSQNDGIYEASFINSLVFCFYSKQTEEEKTQKPSQYFISCFRYTSLSLFSWFFSYFLLNPDTASVLGHPPALLESVSSWLTCPLQPRTPW